MKHQWGPTGVKLPEAGLRDDDVLASIIRITGGNFRLLHRLLTQVARLVEINSLAQVTREVVEVARKASSLVRPDGMEAERQMIPKVTASYELTF